MADRLSDERVAYFADPERWSGLGAQALAQEVQASRKLVADLLALCDGDSALDDVREMIEASHDER